MTALAQLNVDYAGAADANTAESRRSVSGDDDGGIGADGDPGWRVKLWRVSHGLDLLLRLLQSQ